MLLPKLSSKQKQKLMIQNVPKSSDSALQINIKKLQTQKVFRNSQMTEESKKTIRSLSSKQKMNSSLYKNSLQSQKIDFNEKQNKGHMEIKGRNLNHTSKSNSGLNSFAQKEQKINILQKKYLCSESQDKLKLRKNSMKKDFIVQNLRQEKRSKLQIGVSFESTFYKTVKHRTGPSQSQFQDYFRNLNQNNAPNEYSQQFFSSDGQEKTHNILKPECLFRKVKRDSISLKLQTNNKISGSDDLCLDFSVFSIQIAPQATKSIPQKKRALVEQLMADQGFEWKHEKYRQYIQRYSECEIKLKQKLSNLKFLSQNLQLLKQRIGLFKSFDSSKDIVQIVKPTLSLKEEKAYEIKMEMLKWKKKFFTNISKINETISKSCEQKYGSLLLKMHQNQHVINQTRDMLQKYQTKETKFLDQKDITYFRQNLENLSINQKQMTDQINLHQHNNGAMLEKYNRIEDEWKQAFSVFNKTLQNCANKCFMLSDTIQKFYGRSSIAMFLTKGFDMSDQKDMKLIENHKCDICRWNEVKLKKIIQENSLAKDHFHALKQLISD